VTGWDKCELCGELATEHLSVVIGGVHERHLCSGCAETDVEVTEARKLARVLAPPTASAAVHIFLQKWQTFKRLKEREPTDAEFVELLRSEAWRGALAAVWRAFFNRRCG
jgi:hypothetical protein